MLIESIKTFFFVNLVEFSLVFTALLRRNFNVDMDIKRQAFPPPP